jgi:hypothetical protein
MSEPLFTQLIDNDPVKAKDAVSQLISRGIDAAELVDFIQQNIDLIFSSPTARHKTLCRIVDRACAGSQSAVAGLFGVAIALRPCAFAIRDSEATAESAGRR